MIPALSIIISAHNSHETLPCLLRSIARQNLAVEVVLVDDCSRAPYDELVAEWRQKGMEIHGIRAPQRVFTKETRLIGLENATAPIVTFADADDAFWGSDNLAEAVKLFTQHHVDLLHFSAVDGDENFASDIAWACPAQASLHGWDIMRAFARSFHKFNIWGKLYSRAVWQGLVPVARAFPVQRYCEDMYLFFLYALHAKQYMGAPIPAYQYHVNSESAQFRALGRLVATDAILQGFIPYMRSRQCPDDICRDMEVSLSRHRALQAIRYLGTGSAGAAEKMKQCLVEAQEEVSARELLRILLLSNAKLAQMITDIVNPVSRVIFY